MVLQGPGAAVALEQSSPNASTKPPFPGSLRPVSSSPLSPSSLLWLSFRLTYVQHVWLARPRNTGPRPVIPWEWSLSHRRVGGTYGPARPVSFSWDVRERERVCVRCV